MRRQRRSIGFLALMLGSAALVAGCGDDDDGGLDEATVDEQPEASGGDSETTTTREGNILEGEWQATPGQADAVEAALSAKGYECSSHADQSLDIRMCAKGVTTFNDFSGEGVTMGRLRFMADDDGTVVMAAIDGEEAVSTQTEWYELEKEMVEALLPPADAAVLLADGTTLDWGTVEKGQIESNHTFLRIAGFTPPMPYEPAGRPFEISPEDALPALQSAGLECSFEDQPSTDPGATDTTDMGIRPRLKCLDPSFTSEESDGSIEGPTAEAVLVDGGDGISELTVEARHGSILDEIRGVQQLLQKVVDAVGEEPLADIQEWVGSHLDGLPHSTYIGSWQVTIYTRGGRAEVAVTPELPDFGAP